MHITPELDHLISLIAEAKMHFLLAAHGTKPGTPERVEELKSCERLTAKAAECADGMGGLLKIPVPLAVDLRACELGIERLGGAKAPKRE